jgi:5-(hydroxymethyl)furfural/furfural oxidase
MQSISPATDSWDVVIVGAGSAGCVLASRLSERASRRVLLVEAGTDYKPGSEPPEILDIFAGTAHANPRFNWPGMKVAFGPRPGNAPDRRPRRKYNQGRVIGGTSSINGMASLRGLPTDYATWVERGATGWGWDDVLPFFRKLEADSDFDGPMHGKDGPIHLQRYPETAWPGFVKGVIEALEAEGWPRLPDQNGMFDDGIYPVAYCHTDDRRMGAAWRYLTGEVRRRPNLRIIGDTYLERLVLDGNRVTGVEVRQGDQRSTIKAGQVIVSCGALQTPAVLMRNGIGPATELKALGIDVVADRPGVGRNLMEHPGVNFGCFVKRGARLPSSVRRQMFAGLRWSSGLEGCPPGDMYTIPSAKAQWHDIGTQTGLIMMWANRSYSTGHVRLTSREPGAPSDIDFNMCSDERDMQRIVLGTRLMCRLQRHPAIQATVEQVFPVSYSDYARKLAEFSTFNAVQTWVGARAMDISPALRKTIIRYLIADAPSLEELETDDLACKEWIASAVVGHYHASCTCRMGAAGDPMAVTSPSAKVYGVEGLRVCDASLMPTVPCANTNIPTIMIGEKVAATIDGETAKAAA